MRVKKRLLYIVLGVFLLIIGYMLLLQNDISLLLLVQAEDRPNTELVPIVEPIPPRWPDDPVSQMVFFAVLEGLYTDGVSNEIVDLIIPRNPTTGKQNLREHFVWMCPLCHPALDSFRLYRIRPNFILHKGEKNTFGSGIEAKLIESLKSKNKLERLKAIQTLVDSWVSRRLDLMRLTPEEQEEWSRKIEARRKKGMEKLIALKAEGEYSDWGKNCAICDGTKGACE